MEAFLVGLGPVCARAADLLVGSAWKSLALVVLVGLLLRCLPRLSAGMRSALWMAVLLLVLLFPLFAPRTSGPAAGAANGLQAGAGWSFAIAGIWAALSLLRLAQLGASAVRLRGIVRRALRVEAPEPVRSLLQRSRRTVSLCVSADVSRPSVAGFFQPRILLPAGLLEELSDAELKHVVLHELEHLRRHDDWTNLLQKLSLALFPLHPALHWLDHRLCLERELACDDAVLGVTHARKAYAACLARLAEDSMVRRGLSLALGLLGGRERRSELGGRVERILRCPATAMGRVQAGFATAALMAAVLGGAMLLARSPRLVNFASFAAGSEPVVSAKSMSAKSMSTKSMAEADTPAMSAALEHRRAELPYGVVAAKAVMPQAASLPVARAVRAAAQVSRAHRASIRRVAFDQAPQPLGSATQYVVFTAWQQGTDMPHMTLAVAQTSQDSPSSQPTYAAVPVRGGWLLIQL